MNPKNYILIGPVYKIIVSGLTVNWASKSSQLTSFPFPSTNGFAGGRLALTNQHPDSSILVQTF